MAYLSKNTIFVLLAPGSPAAPDLPCLIDRLRRFGAASTPHLDFAA